MRGILSGKRGLAPALLVLIIVWALAAVVMLTGTLVAANRIGDDVAIIRPEVSDIGRDTQLIELARQTNRTAARIRVAAKPLSGELDRTLTSAKRIDKEAKSILGTAGTINRTAKTINGNVRSINATVDTIGGNVAQIGSRVQSIGASAGSIGSSVRGINSSVLGIASSVRGINSRAAGILSEVRVIDGTRTTDVAGINTRAEGVQSVARPIGRDLASVLGIVGGGGPEHNNSTIHGHANSIDCSTVLQALGNTQFCGQ